MAEVSSWLVVAVFSSIKEQNCLLTHLCSAEPLPSPVASGYTGIGKSQVAPPSSTTHPDASMHPGGHVCQYSSTYSLACNKARTCVPKQEHMNLTPAGNPAGWMTWYPPGDVPLCLLPLRQQDFVDAVLKVLDLKKA